MKGFIAFMVILLAFSACSSSKSKTKGPLVTQNMNTLTSRSKDYEEHSKIISKTKRKGKKMRHSMYYKNKLFRFGKKKDEKETESLDINYGKKKKVKK